MSRQGRRARVPEAARRLRTRRMDLTAVLAIVLPLLTVGVLALVQRPPVHASNQPPVLTKLTRSVVVCPSSKGGGTAGSVSTASGRSGRLTVVSGHGSRTVPVKPGQAAAVRSSSSFVAQGSGALAPGVIGLRSGTAPVTGLACPVPSPDQWFTGIGARADHDTILELDNPDPGPALADITVLGTHLFSARRLHDVRVSGHTSVRLDLGKILPRRLLLSARVLVTRGQLAVNVLDSTTNLVTKKTSGEWLAPQLAPSSDLELLGLPTGPAARTLQVANPGTEVVRADVEIVTGDTSFAPKGLKPLSINPGATTSLSLTKVLRPALADGALGIALHADGPITASLVTAEAGDRVLTVPDDDVHSQAATLLPVVTGKGAKSRQVRATLHLTADAAGSVAVTAYDASGKQVLHRAVATQQGRTSSVRLPQGSAYVDVKPSGTPVRGAVLVTGDGATVIPLHELLTKGLVPQISPGLH
jgi:hypothetical protein